MDRPPKSSKELALNLTEQLIEKAREEDELHKREAISNSKAQKTVGESFMLYHLKALKHLISKIE